jgi:hypothetical protein
MYARSVAMEQKAGQSAYGPVITETAIQTIERE